jgi:hypothetical protein
LKKTHERLIQVHISYGIEDKKLVEITLEARAFEYALGLSTVIIGLAFADIATSFHRLVRHRDTVTWDPLTLFAALYALWMCVSLWFSQWRTRDLAETRHFFFYLSLLAEYFLLYLIAATSLPDEPGDDNDLRAYYEGNRRYFWSLIVIFQLSYAGTGIYFYTHDFVPHWPHIAMGFVVPLAVPVVLLLVRSRAVQYVGLAALFVVTGIDRASLVIN